MPKDSENPTGGDEKGMDSRDTEQDQSNLSEESHRKRVRKSSPSPGGKTPPASPPRFVSAEELMETANRVTNMALAHEIIVNGAFKLKPAEPAEGSLAKRVKDIMHQAFWDCLEAQLNEEPPLYDHAIKLLEEIKETLLSFLLPGHSRLRAQIEGVLDLPLIQQQAENGALDISKVAEFVIGMMGSLCAPCRDEDIRTLRDITDIVPLLKAIYSVMDKMKLDIVNFAVTSIRPHLLQQSVEYERSKFELFLEKQPNALDFTEKWLRETAKALANGEWEGGAGSSGFPISKPSSLLPLTVHNHAYLRLLKWDHASVPFPETLLMDQVRFQEMQQDLEQLVMVASVLLIVYNSAGEAISGLPGLMEQLKSAIRILISDMHTASFSAEEAFTAIAEKMCAELGDCLCKHGYSPFSANRQSILKGQIIAVKQPDNSIRKLMDSRVQTYLLGFLESSPHQSPPALPGGLAPISREIEEIAVKFGRLVNFNKLVFSPFYQKILQEVLKEGESDDTEG